MEIAPQRYPGLTEHFPSHVPKRSWDFDYKPLSFIGYAHEL